MENNWREKSLEKLEKTNYGDPATAPTHLVKRCLELTHLPLKNFSVADIRLLIGQGIGLEYLVPLAIEQLERDLFVEADLYPGDLLKNVVAIQETFWHSHKLLLSKIKSIVQGREQEMISNKIPIERLLNL